MEDTENALLESYWNDWPYLWLEDSPPSRHLQSVASPMKRDVTPRKQDIPDLDDSENVGDNLAAMFTAVETWLERGCSSLSQPIIWFGPDIFTSTGPEIFAQVKKCLQRFDWIGCLELEIIGHEDGRRLWNHITFVLESAHFDFAIAKRQVFDKARQHGSHSCKVTIRTREDLNGIFYP